MHKTFEGETTKGHYMKIYVLTSNCLISLSRCSTWSVSSSRSAYCCDWIAWLSFVSEYMTQTKRRKMEKYHKTSTHPPEHSPIVVYQTVIISFTFRDTLVRRLYSITNKKQDSVNYTYKELSVSLLIISLHVFWVKLFSPWLTTPAPYQQLTGEKIENLILCFR